MFFNFHTDPYIIGKRSNLTNDRYFSNGLKPPTRYILLWCNEVIQTATELIHKVTFKCQHAIKDGHLSHCS